MQALRNQVRGDIGRFPSLSGRGRAGTDPAVYREHPGWTAQLHHDNLRVTLAAAGNASLMTKQLRNTLCDHDAGNYRIVIGMAAELAQREITELDERLYLQGVCCTGDSNAATRRRGSLT